VWPWLAAGLLLAAGQERAPLSSPGVGPFAQTLPAAVGDVSGWEVVTGEFETTAERGSYAFYVSPTRKALYQLMRYRVELRNPEGPEERRRGGAERVAFVPRPGVREPMLCWERSTGAEPAWRVVASESPAYLLEMRVLMRVLAVHRTARLATPAPTPTPP
jgi:hypothetical protein